MGKVATTPTGKFINARCKYCDHYMLRANGYEVCTNPKQSQYYGKKYRIGNMQVCDDYEK